jgi:hypothetical protein
MQQRLKEVWPYIAVVVGVIFIMVGVMLASTGIARADVNDDAFISTLEDEGIGFPSREYAIEGGHAICEELAGGKDWTEVVGEIVDVSQLGEDGASFLVGAAMGAYCPEEAPPELLPQGSARYKIA